MKKLYFLFFLSLSTFILNAQHYYLYGETTKGGQYGYGILFRFDPFKEKDTILFSFNGANGNNASRSLIDYQGKFYGLTSYGDISNNGNAFIFDPVNTYETIIDTFKGLNGSVPFSFFVISKKGLLYSTTGNGGKYGDGVIFSYNPISNIDSVVLNFNDTNGAVPWGGLLLLNDTSYYGIASEGGLHHDGLIYRFNPKSNKETTLYNFNGSTDGAYSQGGFIKDSNGLIYGLLAQLGPGGWGTLISFNPSTNAESTLFSFNGTNGKYPFGDLFLATDNLLYGMTELGGSKNDGVLFSYNVNTNSYSIVMNFDSANGRYPDGGDVIEDTINKILYGMTNSGGKYNDGVIFSYNLITKKDSVLFNFDGISGSNPQGTLLMIHDTLPTGLNKLADRSINIEVYPNPSTGLFNIDFAGAQNFVPTVEAYNVLGEKVFSQLTTYNSQLTIDLSSQPSGVYFYRVLQEDGSLVGEGKLIIEK
jgi:uncharacterized repeat protein (TIGR03803 family)